MTVYSELGQLGTVYTDGSGNYSINFTYSGLGNFAVRAGNDALGGNSGFGSAAGTGSETVCTGSGSLVKHEMCPSSSVIGQTLSGFDFTYTVSCTYGMTYETLPNCSEGTYTSSVSGVSGASDVRFATWADAGGMGDDLQWYIGNNLGGGNYNYTVNSANHNAGSAGTIYTDTWIGKCASDWCPQVYCGGTRATRACATPTPTPCASPAGPTNLTRTCNAAGNQVTLSWTGAAGADYYSLRADNTSYTDVPGFCGPAGEAGSGPNDFCRTPVGTSYTFPVNPGQSYGWWVHSRVNCNPTYWSSAPSSSFTCNAPPPVPCQVTTSPAVCNLATGGTCVVTASVTSGLGSATVNQMRFGSYNTAVATATSPDTTSPYQSTVTAVGPEATAVWGTADLSDGRVCQSTGTTDTDVNVTGPTPAAPIGLHAAPDNTACILMGWTCDPDRWNQSLRVDLYEGGVGGTYIGQAVADNVSDAGAVSACGNTQNHTFYFSLPIGLRTGTNRSITAYALGINGSGWEDGQNPALQGNPRTINCAAPTPTPTPAAITVSGGVYDDPNAGGPGPQCTGSLTSGVRPAATSRVVVNPEGRTGAVQANGSYSVGPVAPGTKTLILENLGSYQCICPSGCRYASQSITSANQSGWNFFVSALKPVWWKAVGGHVHSQGNLTSNVPSGQYLIDNASGGYPGVLTRGASVNLGTQGGTVSSQSGWNFDEAFTSSSWRYGYDVLYARAGRPTPTPPGNGNGAPAASGTYLYSGATLTISGTWSNISNKIVIFATGDVQINVPISLTSSGFLAIIAKGNISVNPSVGNILRPMNPTSTDASLTGVFLADGNFRGGSGTVPDFQLVIYGTVGADMDLNGTGTVQGQRDMGIFNSSPGVAYVWNPNLTTNAPSELFEGLTDWREVAP